MKLKANTQSMQKYATRDGKKVEKRRRRSKKQTTHWNDSKNRFGRCSKSLIQWFDPFILAFINLIGWREKKNTKFKQNQKLSNKNQN